MKYVIIGNSTAAIGAVEGIRVIDKKSQITIITNEKHHTYSRPLISYLLEGKTDEERMKYRGNDFYVKNNCTTYFGVTAEKISNENKTVALSNGKTIEYDKLLVATGSSPFVPPIAGVETVKNCFTFMSLDDAKALEKALTPNSKVLIIGAGLIGLKCAEGISARVSKITVADLASRILPAVLDEEASELVKAHIEKQNVEFKLGVTVKEANKNIAIFSDGTQTEFDVLVVAAGVRPNTKLVSDIGGQVNRGIITDKKMQTTIADVYAAGDCTVSYDISATAPKIIAILPNAYHQGFTAGTNMAGGNKELTNAFPMNAVGFFGLHIITAGTYTGECFACCENKNYKKLFYHDNVLKGYIMIGNIDKAGIYTSLIREQTPLTSIDFELICKNPGLIAFSREFRDEKLGGK